MVSEQKIVTYLSAGEIDVIITDEKQFERYASLGYFTNLANELPTEIYSYFSDSFYLATSETDGIPYAAGIYLTDSPVYTETGTIIEKPVVGIVANSKNTENACSFIKYLFKLDK